MIVSETTSSLNSNVPSTQSIKFVCNWSGDGGSSKIRSAAYRGSRFHDSCVRTHLHYLFSCFCQYFCLTVCCLFVEINLTFIQKSCVLQKRLFFSNKINFYIYEIGFFLHKIIFANQS